MTSMIPTNSNNLPNLTLVDGVPMADSRDVAERFGKRHKNVLQAIRNLECSSEFRGLHFKPTVFIDKNGDEQPRYDVTRDGMSFLAMGFTGSEAAIWKERYIEAFNMMEAELRDRPKQAPTHAPSLGYSKEVRLAAGRATSTGRAMGLEGNQLAIFVNKNVHTLTGHDYMAIGGITNLIAPQNEPLLTVTDVAKRLGMGARAVNALLTELGYQTAERDHKGRPLYEPTPKGEANGGVMVDSPKGNGVAGSARQLRWASKIVPALRADLDAENEVAA